jgi:predicted O-methyltransferase YrrM
MPRYGAAAPGGALRLADTSRINPDMLKRLKQRVAQTLRGVLGSDRAMAKQEEVVTGLNNQSNLIIHRVETLVQQIANVEKRVLGQIDWMDARSHRHGLLDAGVIKNFKPFAPAAIDVAPLLDIPWPRAPLDGENPISAIMTGPGFQACADFFEKSPASERSLLGAHSQALIYSVVRNQEPEHVFEIGSFRTGTSEAIARALHANGGGTLHTVDPFGIESVPALIAQWPQQLQDRVRYYPATSMTFFMQMQTEDTHPDLVLVDGNHDYEFAAFDIASAARQIKPGGLVFVDNISQAGPFFAAIDFLAQNPGWRQYGNPAERYRKDFALDPLRTDIAKTDFAVLQAPRSLVLGERPVTPGQQPWRGGTVRAVEVAVAEPASPGTLHCQVVLRGFGARLSETASEAVIELHGDTQGAIQIPLRRALPRSADYTSMTTEIWLTWQGTRPLRLNGPPVVVE